MPEIKVGDKLPAATIKIKGGAEGEFKDVSLLELTAGKKVVIFSVPGAYTPVCSRKHVPGFIDRYDELKSKGVDMVICLAVNDIFVMDAWGQSLGAGSKVVMASDGNGAFAKATGTEVDLSEHGLGVRSKRYAMLVTDGTVTAYSPEPGGALTCSSAETVLAGL